LAASFFQVIFEIEPFRYGGELDKKRGLNWKGVDREEYPTLAGFLDKATHPDPQVRFANVREALSALEVREAKYRLKPVEKGKPIQPEQAAAVDQLSSELESELREQRIDWLRFLLQSYPGSRWGTAKRGAGHGFCRANLRGNRAGGNAASEIRERRIRLVILCGNAGDGKTALLQHLAARLDWGKHQSSERILEGVVPNGPLVRMNLDGSASCGDVQLTTFLTSS